MHSVNRPSLLAIVIAFVFLAACAPQPTRSVVPTVSPPAQSPGTTRPGPSTAVVQPSLIPSIPLQVSDADNQVVDSYHTVLMLERAADLMLAVIVKIDTGELPVGDPTARYPYTDAFPVAIDTFNKTTPPPGLWNNDWKTVYSVAEQYNVVYKALIQGKAISNHDFNNLKAFRQIMANYQNNAEGYLSRKGLGPDFFANQHQAVDRHFEQAYGDRPMPTLTQTDGK